MIFRACSLPFFVIVHQHLFLFLHFLFSGGIENLHFRRMRIFNKFFRVRNKRSLIDKLHNKSPISLRNVITMENIIYQI